MNINKQRAVWLLLRKAPPGRDRILHEYAAITRPPAGQPGNRVRLKTCHPPSITTLIGSNTGQRAAGSGQDMESLVSQHTKVFAAEDLRRFSRMAELQWLLLILVLLYYFIPIHPIADSDTLILFRVCYLASVIVFRYLNFLTCETRWKLAVET